MWTRQLWVVVLLISLTNLGFAEDTTEPNFPDVEDEETLARSPRQSAASFRIGKKLTMDAVWKYLLWIQFLLVFILNKDLFIHISEKNRIRTFHNDEA